MCYIARFTKHPTRLVLMLFLVWFSFGAAAAETDNFYLPLEPEFADLGDYFEAVHTQAIEEGVAQVNRRIERALALKEIALRTSELAQCQTPDTVAAAVASQFGAAPTEIARLEGMLNSAWARQAFPGKTVIHLDRSMNIRGHSAVDPRALIMLVQAGTVKAFGVYLGTDKILHFHKLGYAYYTYYRSLLREGASPEEARRKVIKYFSEAALLGESKFFGTITTGVYSNGDQAANYLGLKFFLNLTEKVSLQGEEREPLVVRCGVFWRVNDQVRPRSGWLRPFFSDHLNEALNPCHYDWTMRERIQKILQGRASHIVEFYTRHDGRPQDAAYFEQLSRTLATYYGEPYGHSGQIEKLMNIGNTCLPALPAPEAKPPAKHASLRSAG